MNFNYDVLDESEKISFALRALYNEYGFERYRMGKFEEYDLYSRNKDFLISDAVITFTDTNGKLMALKPDVTLSIIKNNKDRPDIVKKLYYNENVYRISKGSGGFREILQTGVECFGAVDHRCIREVLALAARSLQEVSGDYMLEISDLTIISAFVDRIPASEEVRKSILKCIGEKNRHTIMQICAEQDIPEQYGNDLSELLKLYGPPDTVLEGLKRLCGNRNLEEELHRLEEVVLSFRDSALYPHFLIDFSAVSDMNYYNGIIFRGFLAGVADSVLSGGQYDRLMEKMGRKSKAIGFAVYMDRLHGALGKGD